MTHRTERPPAAPNNCLAREGQESTTKEGTA